MGEEMTCCKSTIFRFILTFILLGGLIPAGCVKETYAPLPEQSTGAGLELLLLHTNDTHSHIAGIDEYGNAGFDPFRSRGGFGRIASAIVKAKSENDNVIALDAGDQFQGTLFYSVNKWPMLAELDKKMPWQAMTLGNHEFDEGCLELSEFLKQVRFPVLAANLNPEKGCPLLHSAVRPYLIADIRGVPVGIVGIANDQVAELSGACPYTRFDEPAAALAKAVNELETKGVRHIIALTHIGLPADRELARAVEGVDIIVGGHTHTYLGPKSEEGNYPIVERSPSGNPVLVVTAKRAAEYIGELKVNFNQNGVPINWAGETVELGTEIPVDAAVADLVEKYKASLDAFRKDVVGRQNISLPDGMDACRSGECLSGMFIADAMLEFARPYGAVAALLNSGGIRAALPKGELTRGDLLSVQPFGNMLVVRELTGKQLLAALEHGVSQTGGKGPRLLQVAGLRYEVDPTRPTGHRVLKVEMLDARGRATSLNPEARYGAILPDYLVGGGDGYAMLKHSKAMPSPEPIDIDVFERYIRAHTPLLRPVTGRIVYVN